MRRPESISGVLGRGGGKTPGAPAAGLMTILGLGSAWPEVVGELAAAHSRPAAFRKGLLTVATDSPAWAQELDFLKVEIQERLDRLLGPGVVAELRFKAGRGQDKISRTPKSEAGTGPAEAAPAPEPDPELKAGLEEELSRIKDPDLRETILRLRLKAGR